MAEAIRGGRFAAYRDVRYSGVYDADPGLVPGGCQAGVGVRTHIDVSATRLVHYQVRDAVGQEKSTEMP